MSNIHSNLPVPAERIAAFCERWKIIEFELFGSVLTDDFGPDSDVDVMVTFAAGARWRAFDLVDMKTELESVFSRRIDLVERRIVETSDNPCMKKHILDHRQTVYVA